MRFQWSCSVRRLRISGETSGFGRYSKTELVLAIVSAFDDKSAPVGLLMGSTGAFFFLPPPMRCGIIRVMLPTGPGSESPRAKPVIVFRRFIRRIPSDARETARARQSRLAAARGSAHRNGKCSSRPSMRLAGQLGFAAVTSLAIVHWGHHAMPRVRMGTSVCAQMVRAAAPVSPVHFDCTVPSSQPMAILPIGAFLVAVTTSPAADVPRLRQVRLARIGGLYGP